MTLINYFLALFLTLVIEVCVARLFGFKKSKEVISIICVNLISHPVLNYFLWANDVFNLIENNLLLYFLEILAVIVEWILLVWIFRVKKYFLFGLSLTMNFVSFIIGIIISQSL